VDTGRDLQPYAKVMVYGGFAVLASAAALIGASDGAGVQLFTPWRALLISALFPILYLIFAVSFTIAGYSILYGRHPHPGPVAAAWSAAAMGLSFLAGLVGLLFVLFSFIAWWYGRAGGFERGWHAIRAHPYGYPIMGTVLLASALVAGLAAALVNEFTTAAFASVGCAPLLPAIIMGLFGALAKCDTCGGRHQEGGACPWSEDAWPPKPKR